MNKNRMRGYQEGAKERIKIEEDNWDKIMRSLIEETEEDFPAEYIGEEDEDQKQYEHDFINTHGQQTLCPQCEGKGVREIIEDRPTVVIYPCNSCGEKGYR